MAQAFQSFADETLGIDPSGFTSRWAHPDNSEGIVNTSADGLAATEQEQLGPNAWKFVEAASGAPRVCFEKDSLSGTTDDEIEALLHLSKNDNRHIGLLVLRGSGTTEAGRSGYALYIRPQTNWFEIRRTTSGSESTVASGTLNYGGHGIIRVRYAANENGSGNLVMSAEAWPYDDEALKVALAYTDTSKMSPGFLGLGSVNLAVAGTITYWGWVGFGTDGDPAPTGPVGVSEEPFRLRHNPRTNKVIPVLSSPTVTDIGANCVRPRVSKGF